MKLIILLSASVIALVNISIAVVKKDIKLLLTGVVMYILLMYDAITLP